VSLDLLFFGVIALFVAHELDAVRLREWQLLFVLRHQPDRFAFAAFALLHIPIMVVFLWLAGHPSLQVRTWFQIVVDLFAVIHVGLHWYLRNRVQSGFQDRFSRNLICAVGIFGAIHLGLLLLNLQ
jgi:cation transport ATPase